MHPFHNAANREYAIHPNGFLSSRDLNVISFFSAPPFHTRILTELFSKKADASRIRSCLFKPYSP
jgi:hypothetical protein